MKRFVLFRKWCSVLKRIINLFILCGIVLLIVCGCGNNEGINKDDESINSKFTYLKTIIGNLDSNVIGSNYSFLMLDNDTIVRYEFGQLFSNDTNYKVLDANEFEIVDGYAGNGYVGKNDNYDLYLGNGVSLKDNNLYIDNKLIKESEISEDETVIALYSGQEKQYIKTDKAYYYVNKYKTNKEECEKYIDVKCVYDNRIKKDNTLTEYYNNILYITISGDNYLEFPIELYDETVVIFRDNKLYLYDD